MKDLKELLLEIVNLTHSQEREIKVSKVVNILMNEVILNLNGVEVELVELEDFCKSPVHPDPFVYGVDQQKSLLKLYFNSKFRGGIDLCYGNGLTPAGILIRSIKIKATGEIIQGPVVVKKKILKILNMNSSQGKILIEGCDLLDPNSIIKLVAANLSHRQIYASPRVGLSLLPHSADLEQRLGFFARNYRFHSRPEICKKDRFSIYLSLLMQNIPRAWALKISGVRSSEAANYEFYFKRGQSQSPHSYIGNLKRIAQRCELLGALYNHNKKF